MACKIQLKKKKNNPFSTNSVSRLSSQRHQMHLFSTNHFHPDLHEQGERQHGGSPRRSCPGVSTPPVQPASAARHTHFFSWHLFQGGEDALKEGSRTNTKPHSWCNPVIIFKALSFQNWDWGTKLFQTILLLPQICKLVQTARERWPSHLLQEHVSEMEASKWQLYFCSLEK